MKFRIGISILFICWCATVFSSCDSPTALEGPWAGCEIRKPLVDWILNIHGGQFLLFREDYDRWYKGCFKLNNNCALKKIDLQIQDTHAQSQTGKTILGIYELNGDSLTVVLDLPGMPGKQERPLSLDEPRGAMVFNFDRS